MSVHLLSQGQYLIPYLKLHSKYIQNAKYALAAVMETLHGPKIFGACTSNRLRIMNHIQYNNHSLKNQQVMERDTEVQSKPTGDVRSPDPMSSNSI